MEALRRMPVSDHRELWSSKELMIKFCLVVTSDAVYSGLKEDLITPLVRSLITNSGHELVVSEVVPNDEEVISNAIRKGLDVCDVVLISGGTGISRKDLSADTAMKYCSKLIPGYGELFRYLTYLQYGPAAILSRNYACVAGNSIIFLTPGSPQAVELALTKLILPEIKHIIGELRKSFNSI